MLARNLLTTATSRLVALPASFAATILLARWLGAEQRGVFALAILIPNTIYLFGTLGIGTAHIVYAGKYPEKRGAIAFHSLVYPVFILLIALGFYGVALGFRPSWFAPFEPVGAVNHILAAFILYFSLSFMNVQAGVTGANRIPVVNIASMLGPFSRLAFFAVLVGALSWGVRGAVIGQLGSFVLLSVYMVVATAVRVPVRTWRPDLRFFRKSLKFGLKAYLHHIAVLFAHRIDLFMIAFLIADSGAPLGNYAVAAQFAQMVWVLPQSMQTTFLPHLSVTQTDRVELSMRMSRVLFILMIPLLLLVAVFSPYIPVLAGRDFGDAVRPFLWLLPGMLVWGATRPMGSYLTHIEKPLYDAGNLWFGGVLNVGLNLLLIPRMGIAGAAAALTISNVIMGAITTCCFCYETKASWKGIILRWSDVTVMVGVTKKVLAKAGVKLPRRDRQEHGDD